MTTSTVLASSQFYKNRAGGNWGVKLPDTELSFQTAGGYISSKTDKGLSLFDPRQCIDYCSISEQDDQVIAQFALIDGSSLTFSGKKGQVNPDFPRLLPITWLKAVKPTLNGGNPDFPHAGGCIYQCD